MSTYKAIVQIMPRKEILDPQGKATLLGLHNLGIENMDEVRVGKRIELTLTALSSSEAQQQVEAACKKLLVNPIIEQYQIDLEEC